VGLGELHLNRLILAFLARHPEIEVELILNDRAVDLVEEGVDVAIRLGSDLPPNVVARRVGASPRVLVAAPAYLAAAPMLRRPEDLADHECVRYAGLASGPELEFSNGAERIFVSTRGRFRVNNSLAIREALLAGIGLGSAPSWLVQDLIDSGTLAPLLSEWRMPPQPLHLIYPSRRYQPFRARALLQFLEAELPNLPGVHPC
jgi:DNA-binding transcriptional LysR family regulator